MKKIFFTILFSLFLLGCRATVERVETKPVDYYNADFNKQKLVSFIGIDAPNMSNYASDPGYSDDNMRIDFGVRYVKEMSERVGLTLQRRGIALNKTYNYSGAYDLVNLKEYKSKSRYLCFVQFDQILFSQDVSTGRKVARYATALVTYGIGLFIPNKFDLECNADYVIRIYDTKTQEFIYAERKHFRVKDTVNGSSTDLDQILGVYSEYLANDIETNIIEFITNVL